MTPTSPGTIVHQWASAHRRASRRQRRRRHTPEKTPSPLSPISDLERRNVGRTAPRLLASTTTLAGPMLPDLSKDHSVAQGSDYSACGRRWPTHPNRCLRSRSMRSRRRRSRRIASLAMLGPHSTAICRRGTYTFTVESCTTDSTSHRRFSPVPGCRSLLRPGLEQHRSLGML
jgi:hypothetical protein